MNVLRFVTVSLIASFLSLLCANHASAEAPPGLGRFIAAAKRFEELQKVAQAKNTMPRLSDPEVRDLLRTLSDADGLFGTARYDKNDMLVVLDACGRGNRITMAYNFNGLSGVLDKSDSRDVMTSKVMSLQLRNAATFQDEEISLHAFQLRCFAKLEPIMKDFVSSLPPAEWTDIRRQGLEKVRQGIVGMFHGGLMMLGIGNGPVKPENQALMVKPENQALMVSALAETAPTFVEMIPVAQRKSILERAEKIVLPKELKPALDRVIAAMSRTDCDGLCQR